MTLLALRLGRWGIAGFSALGFAVTLVQAAGFYQAAGSTPASRAAFGRSMTVLASQFTVIIPPPIRPDTVGGYVQFRAYGALSIAFAIWALASATGAARGDEERGLVEVTLASGLSRTRMLAARVLAFAVGASIAAVAAGLGLVVGVAADHEAIALTSIFEMSAVLASLAFSGYGLTLLVSQFTSARAAPAVAGMVLLGLLLVNGFSRVYDSLATWRQVSPFRYFELSRPLSPDGNFDAEATLVLVAIGLVTASIAAVAFGRRDLGSPVLRLPASSRRPTFEPSRLVAWRIAVVRGLYERRVALVIWAVGIAVLGITFVNLTKTILEPLLAIQGLKPFFGAFLHGDVYTSFLGFVWSGVAELLFAAFAITQVARWSAEDSDGRLELMLSNPVSRTAIVIERAAVLGLGALIIAAASGVAIGIQARNQSISIDTTRLVDATLLLVPFTLVFAAVGALLAARIPRATLALLGGFAFASYLVTELGVLFKWPAWVQDVSAFKLYGQPLTNGIDQTGLLVMVIIVIAGFWASVLAMHQRDIGA